MTSQPIHSFESSARCHIPTALDAVGRVDGAPHDRQVLLCDHHRKWSASGAPIFRAQDSRGADTVAGAESECLRRTGSCGRSKRRGLYRDHFDGQVAFSIGFRGISGPLSPQAKSSRTGQSAHVVSGRGEGRISSATEAWRLSELLQTSRTTCTDPFVHRAGLSNGTLRADEILANRGEILSATI